VAAIFFENIEKSDARTIMRATQESGNKHTCEFQRIQKFLVAFTNENLFANAAGTVHFSGYVRYLKISTQPAAIFFATIIATEKLIKAKGSLL
jgi:hypothetical protein